MDLPLLLCPKEDQYSLESTTEASCTTICRGITFPAPTKITFIYSYGAGFVDVEALRVTLTDIEMIPLSEFEDENRDDRSGGTLDQHPYSPHDHPSVDEDEDATVSMLLPPAEYSSNDRGEPRRTLTPEVPVLFATTPEPSPMELISTVIDQRCDEGSSCSSLPYIPSSPRYHLYSDEEQDDAIVSMQLVPCRFSSSESDRSACPPPSEVDVCTILLDSSGLEEDADLSCHPESPPYVPGSPVLSPSVIGDGPSEEPSPSGDHAQFEGDSTQFLRWLDGVVRAKGRVPSFINGLELSPEDQKTLAQWLDQFREWRTTVQFPDPPLSSSGKSKPSRPNASTGSDTRPRQPTENKIMRNPPTDERQRNRSHASTHRHMNEVPGDRKSELLDRILQKCEAEGVELSEALWLFQGRLAGICASLNQLVHPTESISG